MAEQVTRTTPDNLSGQPVRQNPDRSDNPDRGIYTLSGCPGRMTHDLDRSIIDDRDEISGDEQCCLVWCKSHRRFEWHWLPL